MITVLSASTGSTIRSITENESSERAKWLLDMAIEKGVADMDLSCLKNVIIHKGGRTPRLVALVDVLWMIKNGIIPAKEGNDGE